MEANLCIVRLDKLSRNQEIQEKLRVTDWDFQLFMSLIDQDRFEGVVRSGSKAVDVSDVMRRLVKEDLLKFDGTPLFPERNHGLEAVNR